MRQHPTPYKVAINIAWFKRDLRVDDNRVLVAASQSGITLPLYIIEDELWQQADMSARHWAFVEECLHDLRDQLHKAGQPLIVRRGEVTQIFETISQQFEIEAIWSHEETGNQWTFERDKKVAAWCRLRNLPWNEIQQHGTQRRLKSRNGWAKAWDHYMAEPVMTVPALTPLSDLELGEIPTSRDLGLRDDACLQRQSGGRKNALELLHTFLNERGEYYRTQMSNPLGGETACSRLSPHLAWGTVSMREVAQITWGRQRELKGAQGVTTKNWRNALTSFSSRLHWHCHFIQKLEDEPRLEFKNLHPTYNGMRPLETDVARLNAWQKGETGLPFVDACMRSLNETGWLNFRMRAMVTAIASYHLWLDWRKPGEHLARQFTDYEPGIHWPQIQMQSGTTGINAIRIYNPVKQGYDQDPDGAFVRRWVPELRDIDSCYLQEPWTAGNANKVLGKDYPFPIIDYLEAAKSARQKIWAVRKGANFHTTAKAIQNKHGSRKSGVTMRGKRKKKENSPEQLDLLFDTENNNENAKKI